MKKNIIIFQILLLFSLLLFQCKFEEQDVQEKTTIVLVNPSTWDIRSIAYLINNQIIEIPNPDLLAVFYSKSEHRITPAKEFVEDRDISFIRFMEVDGDLLEDNLFQQNDCTEKFYNIFQQSEGILFFGGADFPPVIYSQKTSLLTNIRTPHRHYFELSFLFHLLGGSQNENHQPFLEEKPDYVLYGFCLGMQSMNVATGGSMFQDIPSDIYGLKYVEDVLDLEINQRHRNYWRNLSTDNNLNGHNFHKISLSENQFFTNRMKIKNQPFVLSSHHQAVKDLGKEFAVAATSLDGKVVEAIAHKQYENVLGVQFHPESITLYSPNENKYKFAPNDTLLISEHDLIKEKGGLKFHQEFWKYFSSLFLD